ncbi:LOW QUALITY PROTEIN: p450 domain-containing protein, partial [Cephalotus follicularis]
VGFIIAMRSNTLEKWLDQRIQRYGPISKITLFGREKFASTCGHDHKLVRDALMSFLKPESLKQYVGHICCCHSKLHGVSLHLMRTLTFNIICSLLFGFERGPKRDECVDGLQKMIVGLWSVPINLPFTSYNRSLRATARIRKLLKNLMLKKRVQLQKGTFPHQDLITCLLSFCNDDNEQLITEEEIVDNAILVMAAGYETASSLIAFLIQLFANNHVVHASVLQEQEAIAKSKPLGEPLTWGDLTKMRYTWRVAMETMRLFLPIFGGFKNAL